MTVRLRSMRMMQQRTCKTNGNVHLNGLKPFHRVAEGLAAEVQLTALAMRNGERWEEGRARLEVAYVGERNCVQTDNQGYVGSQACKATALLPLHRARCDPGMASRQRAPPMSVPFLTNDSVPASMSAHTPTTSPDAQGVP